MVSKILENVTIAIYNPYTVHWRYPVTG